MEKAVTVDGVEMDILTYDGGGVRQNNTNKGLYKYMSMVALQRLSHRYQYGELKYGASDNYKKGLPTEDCWDSAMRHLINYMSGDNSEDHLAAVLWNVCAIMEMEVNNTEYHNIPSRVNILPAHCTPEYYRDLAELALAQEELK